MKSYILALMAAVAAIVCTPAEAAPQRLKGSGKLITKEQPAPTNYRGISTSRGVRVELVADQGQPMVIEADDNVMKYVVTEVKGGVLVVTIDEDIRTISSVNVTVTIPTDGKLSALKGSSGSQIHSTVKIQSQKIALSVSSAAKIEASISADEWCECDLSSAGQIVGEIATRSCSIDASSAGYFEATIAAQECDVDASSAAQITLKGAALNCEVDLSSAASLRAKNFAVQEYDIEVSSGAEAKILCLDKLDAEASSGGDIRYAGSCKSVTTKRSSGGSIKAIE